MAIHQMKNSVFTWDSCKRGGGAAILTFPTPSGPGSGVIVSPDRQTNVRKCNRGTNGPSDWSRKNFNGKR
jgi:hypothetical protein